MQLKIFSEEEIRAVWNKGALAEGYNSDYVRKDLCGALIEFKHYGNCESIYGWEIDHIVPNGNDSLTNLQPLQWENNRAKSDGPLKCVRR